MTGSYMNKRIKDAKKKENMIVIVQFIVIFIIGVTISLSITSNFSISIVHGHSMEPTLQNGDILIVRNNVEPKDQDIIVLSSDGNSYFDKKDLVKRYYADKSTKDKIWVEGDNKNVSLDSRIAGTLYRDNIYGVVVLNTNKIFRDMIIDKGDILYYDKRFIR